MAGLKENLGKPGRNQEWLVNDSFNFLFQNSANFIAGTEATTATVRVGTPFCFVIDQAAEAADPVTDKIYTVPTGFKLTILLASTIARSSESSGTVVLYNGTDAITGTGIVAATDGAVTFWAAGVDDTKYEIAAGSYLSITSTAGGSGNGTAHRTIVWCLLETV